MKPAYTPSAWLRLLLRKGVVVGGIAGNGA